MFEREEIIRYLIDNTPMVYDVEKQKLKYDEKNINYRIYKYIRELEDEIKKTKGRDENE